MLVVEQETSRDTSQSLVPGRWTVIGVDFLAKNVRTAEKQTKTERLAGISFRQGDANKIPVDTAGPILCVAELS